MFDYLRESGREIKSIFYPDDTGLEVGKELGLGRKISKIEINYEAGQMAAVPWFTIYDDKGIVISQHNGAHLASVNYK